MAASTDPLLQPLKVNRLTLKNRIFSTGHAPAGYLENGVPGLRYALYTEEKARGGLSLAIIGGSSNVAIDSASVFDNFDAGNDAILPFYRDVSDRVHQHNAKIMIQLTHLGRRSQSDIGAWLPSIAPSPVRERAHRSFPKEMEEFDIRRVVRAYAEAARRVQDGGLDGIELSAMAGHLIDQFWSRRTNHRTDQYGGSLENRLRFVLMVLDAVRDAVGKDFAVGMRIPGDEGTKAGLTQTECIDIATALAGTRQLDFFSVIFGSGNDLRELADLIPPFGRPLGAHLPVSGAIREAVDVPVFHAGRIADLSTARYALQAGHADLVGMTRAHIADPHIVTKLIAGEEERIRPCVGATYCVSRSETFCVHNPATGREAFIPQLITPTTQAAKKVVVVGGGPGGLEAARVSAERGHSVTLLEASHQLGGQMQVAARTPRHTEKLAITEWLAAEAKRVGVTVRLNTYAEAEEVLALDPDVVIIATGGFPNTSLPAGGDDLVLSSWDAITDKPLAGQRYLVYDDHGGEQAATAAERLSTGGALVEMITPDRMVAEGVLGTLYPDYMQALYVAGVVLTTDHVVQGVRRDGNSLVVGLRNVYTDVEVERTVDRVVVEQGTLPLADTYFSLVPGSSNLGELDLEGFTAGRPQPIDVNPDGRYQLFRIGDAVAHRNIHAAIFDARRLCMNL